MTSGVLGVVLLILWALGLTTANTVMGSYIHILLIIAAVVLVVRVLEGKQSGITNKHA